MVLVIPPAMVPTNTWIPNWTQGLLTSTNS
jgi:hypothetical protein